MAKNPKAPHITQAIHVSGEKYANLVSVHVYSDGSYAVVDGKQGVVVHDTRTEDARRAMAEEKLGRKLTDWSEDATDHFDNERNER